MSIIAKESDEVPLPLTGGDAERNLIPATEIMLADQLLRLWLTTADQAEAQKLLATLITEQAEPVVKNIVSYKLRTGVGYGRMLEDAEDLCSEIILKVLTVLQQVKTVPPQQTIQAFRNYVAVIAHNTCAEYLRPAPAPQR